LPVTTPHAGQVEPPIHYPMAERSIVASAMGRPELAKVAWDQGLRPSDFFDGDLQRAWTLIGAVLEAGEMPTLSAASERCPGDGLFVATLSEISDNVDYYNFAPNVKKVRNARGSRDLLCKLEERRMDWQSSRAEPGTIISGLFNLAQTNSFHLKGSSWNEINPNLFETGADMPTNNAPTEFEFYPLAPRGCVSDLAGDPKLAGKTTLTLLGVRAKLKGEGFLNHATEMGPVVYLTEQPRASFRVSCRKTGVAGHPDLHILYHSKCRALTWPQIAALAFAKCKEVGASLLIVDTINQFSGMTGDSENNAGDSLTAIAPLQAATEKGIAVLTLSHDRKSGGEVGKSRRGSSAFAGAVDCCLSLRKLEGQGRANMRRILYAGRFDDIPGETVIELTETGYIALGDGAAFAESEARRKILENAPESESEAVDLKSLLEMASVKSGGTANLRVTNMLTGPTAALVRVGCGHRGDPYRYYRNSILSNDTPIKGNKETANSTRNAMVPVGPRTEGQPRLTDCPSDEILL
jgi:hypothetical protein